MVSAALFLVLIRYLGRRIDDASGHGG